jgi:hypothetical protein
MGEKYWTNVINKQVTCIADRKNRGFKRQSSVPAAVFIHFFNACFSFGHPLLTTTTRYHGFGINNMLGY